MIIFQFSAIGFLVVLFTGLLWALLKKFGRTELVKFLFVPLLVFSLGFGLRLSGKPPLVDLGFFLTDFSGLFISLLFASFICLGQLKYWKK